MNALFSFFKELYKKSMDHKFVSLVIIVLIVGGGYYYYSKQTTTVISYQYTNVIRGPLSSTVSSTGQVISQSQVDLKPKVNANVTNVYVKAGDRVRTGQVLFRLDATDAYKQVRDAKASLETSKLALLKLQNPKAIDIMSINNSIKQEGDSIKQQGDSIKQQEDAKKSQDLKVATAYKNLLNSNLEAFPEGSYTTETAPTLTGNYINAKEGQLKIIVYQGGTTGYSFSLSGVASGSGQVNTLVAQPLGDTGLYIKWNNTVPQTNWIIDIPNKQSSTYSSNYDAWQNAITSRDTANDASDRNIDASNRNIDASNRNIANLKQKLLDLTPGDDNLDVQSAKLQITQKENSLADATQALSNYTITAPFDGVMASVSVDIGSSAVMASANSSTALGTIVTDKKMAQATLNEADIVKVKLGQKANISFDAIDGLTLGGTVVEINTLGTVTSGVVTYKVKVAFNTDDVRILPNMSVAIDIITDSKDDVLYIPNQALKSDANGYYIEKDMSSFSTSTASSTRNFANASSSMRYARSATSTATSTRRRMGNGTSSYQRNGSTTGVGPIDATNVILTRIPVTIGMQTDTQTEITSGLREGERIVIKKITTTTSASSKAAPSVTSLLRPQGGGARPAGATSGANFRGQ